MKCVICKKGETIAGRTTVTLERGGLTLVVKSVPARICQNCGEEYVDEPTTRALLTKAEVASREGIQVDIRNYATA